MALAHVNVPEPIGAQGQDRLPLDRSSMLQWYESRCALTFGSSTASRNATHCSAVFNTFVSYRFTISSPRVTRRGVSVSHARA